MGKKTIALLLSIALLISTVPARTPEVETAVGTFARRSSSTLAAGTELGLNTYQHITAGQNEERVLLYTPGTSIQPVVAYGTKLYGMSTIAHAANVLRQEGKTVVAGINGDFFMTDTGIPIGIVVTDGILRSSDAGVQAVGFFADGSAFIGKPGLQILLKTDTGAQLKLDYVNKARKNYGTYLLTEDFSSSTRTSTPGTTIVLNQLSDSLRIGGTVTASISAVHRGTDPVEIAPGTMVLTATDENQLSARLEPITQASSVTIEIRPADVRWSEVRSAVGAGAMLVQSGTPVKSLPAGKAPRTALGITAEGKIVFYTVDGRQNGYSLGMTLGELADRMRSLGCVEAVNLDGGGSTAMVACYPGYTALTTVNSPSEGSLRKGANYIFLVNGASPTAIPQNLHLYPQNPFVLTGSKLQFETKMTDSAYYPVELPVSPGYALEPAVGKIDAQGTFTAGPEEGMAVLYAQTGLMRTSTAIQVLKTPTALRIQNESDGRVVSSLSVRAGEERKLQAVCSWNGVPLVSQDQSLIWRVENVLGEIGTVDKEGTFVASGQNGSQGKLLVTAGEYTVELPVTVGKADEAIALFESDSFYADAGHPFARFESEYDLQYVRFGRSSGRFTYDFNGFDNLEFTIPVQYPIPSDTPYLNGSLFGDGSNNTAAFLIQQSDGTVSELSLGVMNFTGYRFFSLPLQMGARAISGLRIYKQSSLSGVFYIDQLIAAQSRDEDTIPPEIRELSVNLLTEPGKWVFSTIVLDKGYVPLSPENLELLMDGIPVDSTYNSTSGAFSASIPAPAGISLHRITVRATDAAGNRLSHSVNITPGTTNTFFADTAGHWSEPFANFLYKQDVIHGTVRQDGTYFLPDKGMSRAEFAVMISNHLGLTAPPDSTPQDLFTDWAAIPDWAKDAVSAMVAQGIMHGKASESGIKFDPSAFITRAEVIAVLGRTLPKGYSTRTEPFADSTLIPLYAADYAAILKNLNLLSGYPDGTLRPSRPVTRGEAVKMLSGLY